MLETVSFTEAMNRFMFSMKMLLATADHGKLDDLVVAYEINRKMSRRLKAIIDLREEEERAKKDKNEDTLFDLLDSFEDE